MKTTSAGIPLLLLAGLLVGPLAGAQNMNFLSKSPIAQMDEADREIYRATVDAVVAAPDGTATDWSNPATGSRGRLEVLDTHQDMGTTCRNIRFDNQTRSSKRAGIFRLCRAEDGSWRFAPRQQPAGS